MLSVELCHREESPTGRKGIMPTAPSAMRILLQARYKAINDTAFCLSQDRAVLETLLTFFLSSFSTVEEFDTAVLIECLGYEATLSEMATTVYSIDEAIAAIKSTETK